MGGFLLAHWIVPLLAAINPIQGISLAAFFHDFKIDTRVLSFALSVTLATGVIFGLLPAIKGAGENEVMPSLRQSDQHSASAPGHGQLAPTLMGFKALSVLGYLACLPLVYWATGGISPSRRLVEGPSPADMAGYRERFFAALREDFNTPAALAAAFEWIREANPFSSASSALFL